MNLHLEAYDRQPGYDSRRIFVVPDTFCVGWRSTPLSRRFACEWGTEVARLSMREQLSFDHARLSTPNLSVSFYPMQRVGASRLGCEP